MKVEIDPSEYGRVWAAGYDELYEGRDDPDAVISFLGSLAPGGRIAEFGVGTGRLAVPLVNAGFRVTGIDASREMLDLLRARPGSARLDVVHGDFVSADAGGPFDVVLIAFSTLFLVPSQEQQLACLANARRQLRPGGSVVLEAFVPDHSRWARGQNVSLGHLDALGISLKLSVHDAVRQVISTQEVMMDTDGMTLRPNLLRYAWPAELDAMALASGLRPMERWSDWHRNVFTDRSTSHVSVFRRTPQQ